VTWKVSDNERTPWEGVDPEITHALVVALLMKLNGPILLTNEDAIATQGKTIRWEILDDKTTVVELVTEDDA
jgi:hypothetical protein